MSSAATAEQEKKSFKELVKEKKGKVIMLALIAGASLYIWSGVLFGKKDNRPTRNAALDSLENPVQAPDNAPGGPSSSDPTGSSAPRPKLAAASLGPIATFDAAVARIDMWTEPLSHHLEKEDDRVEIETWELPDPEEIEVDEEEVEEGIKDLDLTSTAIFGNQRYAVINGKRLQEGDKINRYEVKEIRTREVVIRARDKTHVLRIADPKLSKSTRKLALPQD